MKIMLWIDVIVQGLIILLPMVFWGDRDKAMLAIGGAVLGFWQVVSSLIHLLIQRTKTSYARLMYTVVGLFLLLFLLLEGFDNFFKSLLDNSSGLLIPVIVLMAVYYIGLSVFELVLIQNKKQVPEQNGS
jgi:hypothetical protein